MNKSLQDKVVLVTGAGKGTGRSVAELLARQGASMAANDISPVNLDVTVRAIQSAGGRVKSYMTDIAKRMPVQALFQDVLNDLGRLDILVNCAEVEPRHAVLDMNDWDWQRTLDVNLTGAFLLTQIAGRVMGERGTGIIIHVGERAHEPGIRCAYFASKAGLAAFVEQARPELEAQGIRLHLITPEENQDIPQKILTWCQER